MAIVGFAEGAPGQQRRRVFQGLVGGRSLRISEDTAAAAAGEEEKPRLQKWSWKGAGGATVERLVAVDPAATAPPAETDEFPTSGGAGMRGVARWSWYPQAESTDELLFPKGAEVQEIEDVNGDWWFGYYMGGEGLFPAPYVRVLEG